MAGDWIKTEENLPDKPEVYAIASTLAIDPDAVVGKLVRVWAWASRNCNADGVTLVTSMYAIDRAAGVPGFSNAMVKACWLIIDGAHISFPNFHRHISQTAKERANTNRRVAEHRRKCNADTVTDVTPEPLQKPLPEKRREEYNTYTPLIPQEGDGAVGREAAKAPEAKPEAPEKSALQLRAEKLHSKRPGTPWDRAELTAWKGARAVVEATTEEDWLLLEWFYSLPQPQTFARKALAQTLNNWAGEITRAKAHKNRPDAGPGRRPTAPLFR